MDLRTALRILREHWLLVTTTTVIGALAGGLYTWQTTPVYEARATLLIAAVGSSTDPGAAYQSSLLTAQRASVYPKLFVGEKVMRATAADLDLGISPSRLATKFRVYLIAGTTLLAVSATDTSATRARDMVNAASGRFMLFVPEFENVPEGKQSPLRVTMVSPATRPAAPATPQPAKNLVSAAILGLVCGAAIAVARNALDRSVRTTQQLAQLAALPVLGTVPQDPRTKKVPLVTSDSPFSARAEAFRKIRIRLQLTKGERLQKVVLITSAVAGEGKSVAACNLALTAAEAGQRVLLIDADLQYPRATQYFGLPGGVGLTSVLTGITPLEVAVQNWGDVLHVLGSGPASAKPGALLGSQSMRRLLLEIRDCYDLVVIDGPPVLSVAEVAVLATSCDGVIPVVRWGRTRIESINNMLSTLRSFETPLLGAVLNAVPKRYNKHSETSCEPIYPNAPSARHQSQISSYGRTQRSLETTR